MQGEEHDSPLNADHASGLLRANHMLFIGCISSALIYRQKVQIYSIALGTPPVHQESNLYNYIRLHSVL